MSLQDLGSLGELLGGLAVLVSLVYLAFQIRQNTMSVRAATSASISESLSSFTQMLSSQPDLARVWFHGRADYDSLNEDERIRLRTVLLSYWRKVENAFNQHEKGFVDPDPWQTTVRHLSSVMSGPGTLRCWSESKSLFSDRFVEFIEDHIQDPPAA